MAAELRPVAISIAMQFDLGTIRKTMIERWDGGQALVARRARGSNKFDYSYGYYW